ncbi:MAG: YbaN family protein [Telluria sp.]
MLSSPLKTLLNIAGVLALLLGVLGLFLPLLPTTPFLLLASACFARGSTRLHRWLLHHRVFGVYLRNVEAGNGIPLKAKIVALAMMWSSLAYSFVRFDHLGLRIGLLATGCAVSIYLWRYLPTLRTVDKAQ